MKLKFYYTLFLFLAFSNTFAISTPIDIKDPGKNKGTTSTPSFLTLPRGNNYDGKDNTYYKFDSLTNTWQPVKLMYPITKDADKLNAAGFDPVRFTVSANKKEISINEDIELTIAADFLDINPQTMFTFEGSNQYTLKMVMPAGFVVTGGTYYDFLQGKVDKQTPRQTYTIKGFFESTNNDNCFKLLRAKADAGINDYFYKVNSYCISLSINSSIYNTTSNSVEETSLIPNTTLATATVCETGNYSVPDASAVNFDSTTNRCLGSGRSPAWFIINVTKAGKMKINISSNLDVDFYCWGPFTNETVESLRLKNQKTLSPAQDGSFDPSVTETCNFGYNQTRGNCNRNLRPDASVGYYILLVTSYTAGAANISFSTVLDGAETNCGNITTPPVCTTPSKPTISADPATIPSGSTTVTLSVANGCSTGLPYWNNSATSETSISGSLGTTYYVVCKNGSCTSLTSDGFIVQSCSAPNKPVISPTAPIIPSGATTVTLYANCPAGTKARWSHSDTTATVQATNGNTYSVRCKLGDCYSLFSTEVTVQNCAPPAAPTISPNYIKLPANVSNTDLTASNCDGTITWSTGATGSTITVGVGNYTASCTSALTNCKSQSSFITEVKTYGCDYEISANSNGAANNGNVGVGDLLQFWSSVDNVNGNPNYSYQWYKDSGINGYTALPNGGGSYIVIPNATDSMTGNYKLQVTQNGSNKACFSDPFYVNISPCSLSASLGYTVQPNGQFYIYAETSPACSSCTYQFTDPNGAIIQTGGANWKLVNNEQGSLGTYRVDVVNTTTGCTDFALAQINNIDLVPNYAANTDNLYCDNISGWVADYNNPDKEMNARLIVKNAAGVVIPNTIDLNTTKNGNRWYYNVPFPSLYKDGNIYQIAVEHINNGGAQSNPYNSTLKVLSCCSLKIDSLSMDETCDPINRTRGFAFRFQNRNTSIPLNYKFYKKKYSTAGQVIYEDFGTWQNIPATIANNTFVQVDGLPTGEYKFELKQGATASPSDCKVIDYITIDCQSVIGGCKAPLITVTPADSVTEGTGVVPILFANFLGNQGLNANTNAGFVNTLALNAGNGYIALDDQIGQSNNTTEAWVYLRPATPITVGYTGDGQKQRNLFRSKYQDNYTNWALSVGSNGVMLTENNTNSVNELPKRIALTYSGDLTGWNHIALVYTNDLASLYVNGAEVAKATKSTREYYKLGINYAASPLKDIGDLNGKGFTGLVDEIKYYSKARTAAEITAGMSQINSTAVANQTDLRAYFTFEPPAFYSYVVGSSVIAPALVTGSTNFSNVALDPALNTVYDRAGLDWYYKGNIVATNTVKYTMPKEMVRVGSYTFTVKFLGENGVQCETQKTVTVNPAKLSPLSGCYNLTPLDFPNTNLTAYNDAYNNNFLVRNLYNPAGDNIVFKLEYLGGKNYKIEVPSENKFLTKKSNTEFQLYLRDRDNEASTQIWKIKMLDSLTATPTVRFISQDGSGAAVATNSNDVNSDLATGAELPLNYLGQNFKLNRATCPTPPKPCVSNGKITVEKLPIANPNAITFLDANKDKLELFINKYRKNEDVLEYSPINTFFDFNGFIPTKLNGTVITTASDNFVARLSGFFCPTQSGNFKFGLAGTITSRLYMSPNEDPRGKKIVINNDEGLNDNNPNYAYNVALKGGVSYYYEIILFDKLNRAESQKLIVEGPGIYNGTNGALLTNFSSAPRDTKPKKVRPDTQGCGIIPPPPSDSDDMPNLFRGDTLVAADFKVIIDEVSGSNGTFTGRGHANIKYLFDTPLQVSFAGIRVNDYYELVGGEITTDYDKDWGNVTDIDTLANDFVNEAQNVGEAIKTFLDFNPLTASKASVDSLSIKLLKQAEEELDAASAAQYLAVINCLKIPMATIEYNRANCNKFPPVQISCDSMTAANTYINNVCRVQMNTLEAQRQQKLTLFSEIIKLALDRIKLEQIPINGSKLSLLNSAISVLGYSEDELTPEDDLLFSTVELGKESDLKESNLLETEKLKIVSYFEKEVKYNYSSLLYNFAHKKNNDAIKVGEELVLKNGKFLSKYILEQIGNGTPTVAQKQLLAYGRTDGGSVKDIITNFVIDIFNLKIYSQDLIKN
jgi:hypothetical protein